MIEGKTLDEWGISHPVIKELVALHEVTWFNPAISSASVPASVALGDVGLTRADMQAASERLRRFAPYIAKVFPETAAAGGMIESGIQPLPALQQQLLSGAGVPSIGTLWLKKDNDLPISGSIKARGGILQPVQDCRGLNR